MTISMTASGTKRTFKVRGLISASGTLRPLKLCGFGYLISLASSHNHRLRKMMIVRTWYGRNRLSDGDDYESFMKKRAAPDDGSVDGLQELFFTRRDEGDVSHFLLITVWDTLEAVNEVCWR